MKNLFSKLLVFTIVAGISACSSDDSAEQPAQEQATLSVNFNTVTSPFDIQAQASSINKQASGGNFVFDDGFITLSSMEYEAESENDLESVEFELEQVVVIDFATGIPTPDIMAIAIPAGTYEEVEIEVELFDETEEPSIVLNGTYTSPNGTAHPVRFEFNSGEEFEVEREGTIVFTEDQPAIAEITFDPSVWFALVTDEDMESANKNMDGIIVISEDHNTDIFETVEDGLDLVTDLEFTN
ncbi:hypothetical protein LB467_11835 [Salegentibacter sp. JZCK2]|uniref:hypothetical protein n=1 Tax=Salegentibacter tibetensis TaxID=2873600 RepID=UPI001CCFA573|nr:hypothetical protein [Salegentibacter tibetensis]MBZ9730377.1 hypothetical protein [Salegentibacter tibetensis]